MPSNSEATTKRHNVTASGAIDSVAIAPPI
jgi:hypothetical protein